ncbi:11657_t:CDS:2, partial [Dentiscutata heterogama]
MLEENPLFVLHALPKQNKEGFANIESFEAYTSGEASYNGMSFVMGTSGCGKTHLCLELLCKEYGLYFVGEPSSFGSEDLKNAAEWTMKSINRFPEEAKLIAERAIWSCVTARLVLLHYLLKFAKQHDMVIEPKSWLFCQLFHPILDKLQKIFINVDITCLENYGITIMKEINDLINIKCFFPIVYDEAQAHISILPNIFPSQEKEKARPFFSWTIIVACERANDARHRHSRLQQFWCSRNPEQIIQMVTNIILLEDNLALSAIKWLMLVTIYPRMPTIMRIICDNIQNEKLSPRDLLTNGIVNHTFLQKYHKRLFDLIVEQDCLEELLWSKAERSQYKTNLMVEEENFICNHIKHGYCTASNSREDAKKFYSCLEMFLNQLECAWELPLYIQKSSKINE